MECKDIIARLRRERGLTQDGLAEKLLVTRQAVSRWETGGTVPNTEALKLLSKTFDVSINTLLGAPRALVCQCCGMPLGDDGLISRESDGAFNEDYCRWCYADGQFAYHDLSALLDTITPMMAEQFGLEPDTVRRSLAEQLPKLKYWQK